MDRKTQSLRRTAESKFPGNHPGHGGRLCGIAAATLFVFGAVAFLNAPRIPSPSVPPPPVAAGPRLADGPQDYPGAERVQREILAYAARVRDLQADLQPTPAESARWAPSPSGNDPFAVRTELVPVISESAGSRVLELRAARPASGGFGRAARPGGGGFGAGGFGTGNPRAFNTEEYDHFADGRYYRVADQERSTFSIDVDTASYSNLRRFLAMGHLPPPDAVRIEEMLNNFSYEYPPATGADPFSVTLEIHPAPWQPRHKLVRIGLRGKEIPFEQRPVTNLVFLIDVSGSMRDSNKLPLVRRSLRLLVDQLRESDRVAIVVYAGSSGLVLPSTSGDRRAEIVAAIDRLEAGGSTNGGAGIDLAYRVALEHFVPGGVNRVLLCTDGDFNVGTSSEGALVRLIEEKRKSGVFLSVLGFGTGNYADARMQALADKGNGNAYYIDRLAEARKVLVEQASGTLITIARDVKVQVEFNPAKVAGYRLIGYENRMLEAQDFNDDRKDAGEIGAGHQVTALYEVVPAGLSVPCATVDPLKYGSPTSVAAPSSDWLTVKLRYKAPGSDESTCLSATLADRGADRDEASADFHFAASVAVVGMLLRDSEHKGQSSYPLAIELALAGAAGDAGGTREEFVELARTAQRLATRK